MTEQPVEWMDRDGWPEETMEGALVALGFEVDLPAEDRVEVSGVPAILDAQIAPRALRDSIEAVVEEGTIEDPVDRLADRILGDLACYPAITGNTRMSAGSMLSLLEALDDCSNPRSCPHGRPVLIRIDTEELSERFERTYPGHTTRRPE